MEREMKYVCVIGGMLLAVFSMAFTTCAYVENIPYKRQKYCIDHGYGYEWDSGNNGVKCIEKEK